VDSAGTLTGQGIMRVELLRKDLALSELLLPMGVGIKEVVAVGDSKYDLHLVKACERGIAFVPSGVSSPQVECPVATNLLDVREILRTWDRSKD